MLLKWIFFWRTKKMCIRFLQTCVPETQTIYPSFMLAIYEPYFRFFFTVSSRPNHSLNCIPVVFDLYKVYYFFLRLFYTIIIYLILNLYWQVTPYWCICCIACSDPTDVYNKIKSYFICMKRSRYVLDRKVHYLLVDICSEVKLCLFVFSCALLDAKTCHDFLYIA